MANRQERQAALQRLAYGELAELKIPIPGNWLPDVPVPESDLGPFRFKLLELADRDPKVGRVLDIKLELPTNEERGLLANEESARAASFSARCLLVSLLISGLAFIVSAASYRNSLAATPSAPPLGRQLPEIPIPQSTSNAPQPQ